jgi:hypothetical protein
MDVSTGLPVSIYTTKTPIDMWRFSVPKHKEFLPFSVKDRYQLNYFICIKDFNAPTPIDMWRFSIPKLKEFLTFSAKDRYQLNYFICTKDFNAPTIISLKLNLFSFFIYCCPNDKRKTICLDIFLLSDRQWEYRTQVFTRPFSWRRNITITYNLPHLRL